MSEKKTSEVKDKKTTAKKTSSKSKLTAKEKEMAKTITQLEEDILLLQGQLEDQKERVQAAEEKMLRVVAEYENGKKRVEREKERSLTFAKERMITGLFPIIDNLERSAKFEREHEDQENQQHGVQLVLDQMNKYLKDSNNVEGFDPMGESFDPEFHEAMAMQPAEGVDAGVVIAVFEKGYRSGDRVLRAAKVVVSQ
jgi:molecular chaperone GrpE